MHPIDALTSTSSTAPSIVGSPIIAGDGYFYVAYTYQQQSAVSQSTRFAGWGSCGPPAGAVSISSSNSTQTTDTLVHLMLMRVGSDGSSSKIDVKDWESKFMDQSSSTSIANCPPIGYCNISSSFWESVSTTGAVPASPLPLQMITNADQGTLLSWEADTPAYCASATSNTSGVPPTCTAQVAAASTFAVATTSGASASRPFSVNIPGQATPLYPVLQTQDGSYAGYVGIGPSPGIATQYNLVAFNKSGSIIWSVPNDFPQTATADGGVIGSSGITYDNRGRANGQNVMPIQSWTQGAYQYGSIEQIAFNFPDLAMSFAAMAGGNPAANQTAIMAVNRFYRRKIAENASSHLGDSQTWNEEGKPAQCNQFVHDVLEQTFGEAPDVFHQKWKIFQKPVPAVAADWADEKEGPQWQDQDGSRPFLCWKIVPEGPDGAKPGDILATGWPQPSPDGTGHVGLIVDPIVVISQYSQAPGVSVSTSLVSAASVAPWFWADGWDLL